jgi:hypothetical protein
MKFELGAGVRCDLQTLIDTRALIQANSGSGKSHTLRRLLEQTHGKVQQLGGRRVNGWDERSRPRDLSRLYREDDGVFHCRLCEVVLDIANRPALDRHAEQHLAACEAIVKITEGISCVVPTSAFGPVAEESHEPSPRIRP